jgi:hypothetical protein
MTMVMLVAVVLGASGDNGAIGRWCFAGAAAGGGGISLNQPTANQLLTSPTLTPTS